MNVRRRTVQNSLKSEVTLYNTAQLETYKTTTYVLYALFYSLRAYLMQAVPLASTSFDLITRSFPTRIRSNKPNR